MAAFDEGLRLFQVHRSSSKSPRPDVGGGSWLVPSKMGGRFSSTCWFYGRDIYSALSPKVPFGLIEADVGGTPDEHWSSPDALKACMGPKAWNMPEDTVDSVLWNAMIVGLLRTTISGVVWYQVPYNHRLALALTLPLPLPLIPTLTLTRARTTPRTRVGTTAHFLP